MTNIENIGFCLTRLKAKIESVQEELNYLEKLYEDIVTFEQHSIPQTPYINPVITVYGCPTTGTPMNYYVSTECDIRTQEDTGNEKEMGET